MTPPNLKEFVNSISDYPETYKGRGIVTSGGGHKWFPSLYVLFKQLRFHGCKLPIQCFYLGEKEYDVLFIEICRDLDVEFIDSYEVRKKHPHRTLNGWENKAFAILHSSFEEVLFLDADNTPVRDPSYLFDYDEFRKGDLFWPDCNHQGHSLTHPFWEVFDVPFVQEPEQESGQILINKKRSWKAINTTNHILEYGLDYYWDKAGLHGDKDTFRAGWKVTNTPYFMCPHAQDRSIAATMVQKDWAGQPLFLHRNLAKWSLRDNSRIWGFYQEEQCFTWLEELRKRFRPDLELVQEESNRIAGTKWIYNRLGYDRRNMTFSRNGKISDGGGGCESFYEVCDEKINLYGEYGDLTCTLFPCKISKEETYYVGRWNNHERMPILLEPFDK